MTAYEFEKQRVHAIKPLLAYNGGNTDEWLSQARETLACLLGMDTFSRAAPDVRVEYDREEETFREVRFTFQSEEGYRVPCHLLLPKGIKKPPVMICLQGHSTGMHISLGRPKYPRDEETISGGDRDFAVRAIKEGFAAVTLEQRNFGECGGTPNGPNCFDECMTALLTGRTTVGERVWDVMRLIDVLEADFAEDVDVRRLGLMGNSGGGTTTVYAAALEGRLSLAMPSCAVSTYADSIGSIHHCACNYVPQAAKFFDMGDVMAMAYPTYLVQVSGARDPIFPLEGARKEFARAKAFYKACGADERAALVIGDGEHRFYADDAWPIVHRYFDSMKERKS